MTDWINVKDELPNKDVKVWFWLVPTLPEDCPHDTSGNPITVYGKVKPYMEVHRWNCWSGLMSPTHWQPLPEPPTNET